MTTIKQFHDRLAKIGIEVGLRGNYPWVYLDTVNGKKVQGLYQGNHGFTCFFMPVRADQKEHITDISIVFKKIRQTLNGIKCNHDFKTHVCDGDLYFISGGEYDVDYYICIKCDSTYMPLVIDGY